MKKLTLSQLSESFKDNAAAWSWSAETTESEFETHEIERGEDEEETIFVSWVAGYATAENKAEGLKIDFSWTVNGGQDSYESAFDFAGISIVGDIEIEGFNFVDDDGDDLDISDVRADLAEELEGREWEFLVRAELPTPEIENIEEEESEMEEFIVERDNDRNLKFRGELIASVGSSANNASGSYSGSVGRWTELYLYKTAGGKYICQSVGHTQWQGEHTRYAATVCESIDGVLEFFGNSWLAKELYESAKIDSTITVD